MHMRSAKFDKRKKEKKKYVVRCAESKGDKGDEKQTVAARIQDKKKSIVRYKTRAIPSLTSGYRF
jgi:hypothetical protein